MSFNPPILWPPHVKSWLIGKVSEAGRDWGQEDNGTTKDEMVGWHHWLNGRESQWTLGVGVGQGGLACCDSWGRKGSDTTEWLIWYVYVYAYVYVYKTLSSDISCVKSLHSCLTLCIIQTLTIMYSQSMGYLRWKNRNGLPFLVPADLPNSDRTWTSYDLYVRRQVS